LEQSEFKFEKNFGTYKSAGKVRKVFYKIEKKTEREIFLTFNVGF
jgi:hypothetical protein